MHPSLFTLISLAAGLLYLLGILAAIDAVYRARSPQSAIAWSLSLLMFPLIALPLYLFFSGRKFTAYLQSRRAGDAEIHQLVEQLGRELTPRVKASLEKDSHELAVFEHLARFPFMRYNRAHLLINGEATFDAILRGIDQAREYILMQFYIVKDDHIGNTMKDALIRKAGEGVRVNFMYDIIGSYSLPESWLQELEDAGIQTTGFGKITHKRITRLQLNFRNHRKIIVIDGKTAFVGGINIGDEYLGRDPEFSPWRDTHVEIHGPAALCVQLTFLEDWFWMMQSMPEVNWHPALDAEQDQQILTVPSGPADELDTCGLMFTQLIHAARERVWIVSPYFVPDETVISALQLAVLRGVDVRILIPQKADHRLVQLAGFSYLDETIPFGIRIFRYTQGFLHQKVVLVDDTLAGVGTANLDNRSFVLNFEITLLFASRRMIDDISTMLQRDFDNARELSLEEFSQRPLWFRFAVKVARLLSPLL